MDPGDQESSQIAGLPSQAVHEVHLSFLRKVILPAKAELYSFPALLVEF